MTFTQFIVAGSGSLASDINQALSTVNARIQSDVS